MNTNTRTKAAPSHARNFQDRKPEKPNRAGPSVLSAADSGNTPPRAIRRVLVTGATGYLGRSLSEVLAEDFDLIRMDVAQASGPGEFLSASVTDGAALEAACQRVDAVVLAHMAPNRPKVYDWPDACMDTNVKGTALAFEAAARNRIRRVVLISSISVVGGHPARAFPTAELPFAPVNLYTMTKMLQENIAGYYHRRHGMEIAILRPAYILREDSLVNKYGTKRNAITWHCIDPRDIGRAVRGALFARDLKLETFYLAAGPEAEEHIDLAALKERLEWMPRHRFEGIAVETV
ncbi:MAG: NAD(P)-dependent oxidoreductase [Terrimicrobiaceae bacterium]